MAARPDKPRSQVIGEAGVAYRKRLIDKMLQAVGNRASDAVKLSPTAELQRYMLPTSDAALIAFKRGGSVADAEQANALSAEHARQQQAALTQQLQRQGATPKDVLAALQQQGLTDDQIFATHRRYAHALGKSASLGDPAKEVAYHQRLAEKAAAARASRPTIATLSPERPV